jgi:hypothetical protein
MKRLLILLLILCVALGAKVWAKSNPYILGTAGGSGACSATYGSELATEANATDDNGITNGGGEADATTGWSTYFCSPFDSITDSPYAGSTYHLTAVADAVGERIYRDLSAFSPSVSTMYRLRVAIRHNGVASDGGEWRIGCGGGNSAYPIVVAPTGFDKTYTTYVLYTKYIFYNDLCDFFVCRVANAEYDGGIYVDWFSFQEVTSPCLGTELFPQDNAASLDSEVNATGSLTSTGTSTFESSTTAPADGTWCIYAAVNANGGKVYYDLSAICSDGKKYFMSFNVKRPAAETDTSFVGFCGSPTSACSESVYVDTTVTAWVHVGLSFVYSSDYNYFVWREYGGADNAKIYLDSISIKEITSE